MEEDNLKLVQDFFAALNAHDLARMDEMRAPGFTSDSTLGSIDIMRIHNFDQLMFSVMPDIQFEITLTVKQRDIVVVHWRASGTHTGVTPGDSGASLPPSGKRATILGSHTFEIKDGKIARNWLYTDMLNLFTQLGLIPSI